MRKVWFAAIVPAVAAMFVAALLVIKLLWAWVVPDVAPGAVEQGLVAGKISWYTALKLAVVFAVLGGASRSGRSG